MTTLLTGAAGFIGMHVARRLLAQGERVVGYDNLNPYYPVELKKARLAELEKSRNFVFHHAALEDAATLAKVFEAERPQTVINLAAQAGVRYSLKEPRAYIDSNVVGFMNVLECCRHSKVEHLVFASSSSVYGANSKVPFSTADHTDHPVSLYAATKKANEMMAHSYSHLFGIPMTGLRFFTVYGPWGRPDMAYFSFAKAIMEGKTIDVFNGGDLKRDFTYVDDVVEGILRVATHPAKPSSAWSSESPDPSSSSAPYRIYNIGNHQPVSVLEFIKTLEAALGMRAEMRFLPMQPGDVYQTYADCEPLAREFGFAPNTSLSDGLNRFAKWFKAYVAR